MPPSSASNLMIGEGGGGGADSYVDLSDLIC